MTGEKKTEGRAPRARRSLSQLLLAFAAIGFCSGIAIGSPDGRLAGFVVMALGGALAAVIGPSGLRWYAVPAAVIGITGITLLSGSLAGSPYQAKARVQAAYDWERGIVQPPRSTERGRIPGLPASRT